MTLLFVIDWTKISYRSNKEWHTTLPIMIDLLHFHRDCFLWMTAWVMFISIICEASHWINKHWNFPQLKWLPKPNRKTYVYIKFNILKCLPVSLPISLNFINIIMIENRNVTYLIRSLLCINSGIRICFPYFSFSRMTTIVIFMI